MYTKLLQDWPKSSNNMMNSTRRKRKLIIHTKSIHHKDKLCSPTCLRNSSLIIRISNSIWQATQAYMKSHCICKRRIPFKRRAQDILVVYLVETKLWQRTRCLNMAIYRKYGVVYVWNRSLANANPAFLWWKVFNKDFLWFDPISQYGIC